ncbi:MAG: hypothetical protein KBT48_01165 [Firmicutes bacterium]|nr:hypothetical protein [Bacillota bacterium]
MSMKLLGFITGLIVALVLVMIIKSKATKTMKTFDERQMVERANAFKIAYWVLAFFVCMYGILMSVDGALVTYLGTVGLFSGFFLSVAIFAIVCIWKEAYQGINENKNWLLIGLIGVMNIVVFIYDTMKYGFVEDGALSFHCINLECGILMVVVLVTYMLKKQLDKRED